MLVSCQFKLVRPCDEDLHLCGSGVHGLNLVACRILHTSALIVVVDDSSTQVANLRQYHTSNTILWFKGSVVAYNDACDAV